MKRAVLLAALGLTAAAGCRPGSSPPGAPVPAAAPAASGLVPQFKDVTEAAGVRFRHFNGAYGRYLMPESLGVGGAFLDFDGDGWLDLFLVNGANWPGQPAAGKTGALYRNQQDGTFRDVTRGSGLEFEAYGQGCAAGDFDNDGRDDLLVTCVGQNRLLRNLGGGKFRDITRGSGLDDSPKWAWHTSAAWLDYDRDGKLDLFVCRYVKWSPTSDIPYRNGQGKLTYGGPQQYNGDASVLYRNLGGGRFKNVSAETGIAAVNGKGLGVTTVDEDGDGWVDLMVANDLVANHFWRNEGGKRFREVAQEVGVAVAANGLPRAGMGIDSADVRSDGGLAFAVGNFTGEGLALFDREAGLYTDRAASIGLSPASLSALTFGTLFADFERDGGADLFIYNGHIDPFAEDAGGQSIYRQKPLLFQNRQGSFVELTAEPGSALAEPQVGRGCAWGDWDNDGRPDLLLCENSGPARLLRNTTPDTHHWLGVRLRGRQSNRNGYGAEVRLTAAGVTQRRWPRSGSSYLTQSDSRALFGLGATPSADVLEVRWPSGRVSRVEKPPVDQYLEVDEAGGG